MTSKANLVSSIEAAAAKAGLKLVSTTEGSDLNGQPTQVFQLGLPGLNDRRLQLELTEAFDFDKPNLLPEMAAHLAVTLSHSSAMAVGGCQHHDGIQLAVEPSLIGAPRALGQLFAPPRQP